MGIYIPPGANAVHKDHCPDAPMGTNAENCTHSTSGMRGKADS